MSLYSMMMPILMAWGFYPILVTNILLEILLNTGNKYSVGNTDSSVPIPHVQDLENDGIEAQLEQMWNPEQNMLQPI